MKRIWLGMMLLSTLMACMDKPTGESDDPQVELNELVFDRLYATEETASGKNLLSDSKSAWQGTVHQQKDHIFLELKMPEGFVIPYDPDAPDTLPAKVKNLQVFVMIADAQGNAIFEQRATGDLSKINTFRYDLPDMAFRKVAKGPKTFQCKASFHLEGVQGSKVGSTLAEWSFEIKREIPPIYKTNVSFSEFRLSDVVYDKSKSNNDGLGNPLPDLFWTFKSEGYDNFKSSTFENSNPYFVEKLTFNFYHIQKDAPLLIQVWDDDYTSLNDKLAEWNGALSQIQADTYKDLQVRGLDYFKIHAGKSVICNP